MKYIIEIKPEYEDSFKGVIEDSFKGVMILGAKDSNLFVDTLAVDNIEELNSDYINEHYGDLQDDAYERGHGIGYQKGFEDGKAQAERGCEGCKYGGRELNKLPCMVCSNSHENCWTAKLTAVGAAELREKLEYQKGFEDGKAVYDKGCEGCKYEGRTSGENPCFSCARNANDYWTAKDDKIEVGDEVEFHHDDGRPDTVVVVTYIGQDGFIDGMDGRGTQYAHKNPTKWTKTGRHFDIASILKEMQS